MLIFLCDCFFIFSIVALFVLHLIFEKRVEKLEEEVKVLKRKRRMSSEKI